MQIIMVRSSLVIFCLTFTSNHNKNKVFCSNWALLIKTVGLLTLRRFASGVTPFFQRNIEPVQRI